MIGSGLGMLVVGLGMIGAGLGFLVMAATHESIGYGLSGIASLVTAVFIFCGLFTLQPNQAAVLVLFGNYLGTEKRSGIRWANPFARKFKMSLRTRNLNGDKLKVNDQGGNPVEIAAIVVWKVHNTAQAMFDVDNYEKFLTLQCEAATRHLATMYPYDGEEGAVSLRGSMNEVSEALKKELEDRVAKAGIEIEEVRLSHLAYAPEIAQVMLRRQQAEAVIAARQKIVHGAVSMVEMALQELTAKKILNLDDERKAAMVSNLLVVLCGEAEVQPVVNTGTLYA